MLSCKEVTEVCSAEMERPLKWGEQVSLRTHLMMCSGCSNYRKQMKILRHAMQAYAEGLTPAAQTDGDEPVGGAAKDSPAQAPDPKGAAQRS